MSLTDGPYRLQDLARDKDNVRLDEMGYRAYRLEYVQRLEAVAEAAKVDHCHYQPMTMSRHYPCALCDALDALAALEEA